MSYRVKMENGNVLEHSAKGSTWKDHKYIKKVGDRYYYVTKGQESKWKSNLEKGNRSLNEAGEKQRQLSKTKAYVNTAERTYKEGKASQEYIDDVRSNTKVKINSLEDEVSRKKADSSKYYNEANKELTKHDVTKVVNTVNDIKTKASTSYNNGKNAVTNLLNNLVRTEYSNYQPLEGTKYYKQKDGTYSKSKHTVR